VKRDYLYEWIEKKQAEIKETEKLWKTELVDADRKAARLGILEGSSALLKELEDWLNAYH